jgi:hypothetical protein
MCKRLQTCLALLALLALIAVPAVMAQDAQYLVIEDFEGEVIIPINVMANGPDESPADFELVENPAPNDVNPSATVMRFRRDHRGDPWAGFWGNLEAAGMDPLDMTEMKYVHVQVLKPRISPVRFKVEGGTTDPPAFEILPMEPQTVLDEWENLVFYFEHATGLYPTIVFMPDFEDPVTLEEDIFIYFDNIILSDSSEPPQIVGTEPPEYRVVEDFEGEDIIPINVMANGPDASPADFERVANPAPDEVNPSDTVMRFRRDHRGDPWAGFWSNLQAADMDPLDMTDMKYVHVQVFKPRVSPVRFKVEGGTTDPPAFEILPMEPQTAVDEWQNLVFHFVNATGTYPTLVFMPDFEDPVTLDADIFIYFDNIILSNSPEAPLIVSTEPGESLPVSLTLSQNYPNPFNSSTSIDYQLEYPVHVSLKVYNMLGQLVSVLVDDHQLAGRHTVTWDAVSGGAALPSGLYFYALETGGRRVTRPMVFVR